MNAADAYRILREGYALGCRQVMISGLGEATIHKNFYEILSCAKETGYRIECTTNGWALDPEKLGFLSHHDRIRLSIDAMHLGGSPDPMHYVSRMKSVITRCRNKKFHTLVVIHGTGVPEIDLLVRKIGISSLRYPLQNGKFFSRPLKGRPLLRCNKPWISLVVAPDLTIEPCCSAYGYPVGDVRHNKCLEEIWNGDDFQDFRRSMYSENPPEVCLSCNRWNRPVTEWMHLLARGIGTT